MNIYTIEHHLATNLFTDNKYSHWYVSIIANAQMRDKPNGYTEHHHFIPNCMGGTKTVVLTGREHFIVHWLLTKFTSGIFLEKMRIALLCMRAGTKRYNTKITARVFQQARNDIFGENNSRYDHTEYDWYNYKTKQHVRMTQNNFYNMFNLNKGNVLEVVQGKYKSVKGWRLDRKIPTIYEWHHVETDQRVRLPIYEFYKTYNLSSGNVSKILGGKGTIIKGWHFRGIVPLLEKVK